MSKKETSEPSFKFWRANKIDQEYSLTASEIKEKYLEYLKEKPMDWIIYYGNMTVNHFVSDNKDKGLNSAMEDERTVEIQDLLQETRWIYIESIQAQNNGSSNTKS